MINPRDTKHNEYRATICVGRRRQNEMNRLQHDAESAPAAAVLEEIIAGDR
jgi:hypothetical protein